VQKEALAPKINLSTKKKVAFICSGGAVKAAAFHVGVAMALEEAGFIFEGGLAHDASDLTGIDPSRAISCYVGSSAGALISAFLSNGGSIKELQATFQQSPDVEGIPGLKYWEMLSPRMRSARELLSFDNFFIRMLRKKQVQSVFGTEGISRYLRENILKTERFSELRSDLYIVTTELNRPQKVIFGKEKLSNSDPAYEYRTDVSIPDACAASMSLPPIYHPYSIQIEGERREFFDGEIWEPLSSHVGRDLGCDLVICSYTHQPMRLARQSKHSIADMGIEKITLQAIYQSIEQKIRSARGSRRRAKEDLDIVKKFCKDEGIEAERSERLLERLEQRMVYNSEIDYIYIHPRATDLEMFNAPHFSLNRTTTESITRKGYIAGKLALRNIYLNP